MEKICKEYLFQSIIGSIDSDDSLIELGKQQKKRNCIEIPFSVGGILAHSGDIDIKSYIIVFEDGYYIISDMGRTAAKSAIPELIRFIEMLNSYISYGNIILEPDAGRVGFRTYERFWNEHAFNPEAFYDAVRMHIEANKNFSNPIHMLIKGASSASSQIKQLRKQGVL